MRSVTCTDRAYPASMIVWCGVSVPFACSISTAAFQHPHSFVQAHADASTRRASPCFHCVYGSQVDSSWTRHVRLTTRTIWSTTRKFIACGVK